MNWNEVVFDEAATEKIIEGVNIVANAVKVTMGPNGRVVFMDDGLRPPRATQDGVTVARAMKLGDPLMNMGAQAIKEVANNSENNAGDGTTTATVLAQEILEKAMLQIKEDTNVSLIREGIIKAGKDAVEIMEKDAMKFKNDEEGKNIMRMVANIASNGDTEISENIMKAMDIIGEHGAVKIDIGRLNESYVQNIEGMTYSSGLISRHFADNQRENSTTKTDPLIFFTDHKVESLAYISNLFDYAVDNKKRLIIVCSEIDNVPLQLIYRMSSMKQLDCIAITAPGFGSEKEKFLEDMAIYTGGKAILKGQYPDLDMVQKMDPEEVLGEAVKVSASMTEFTLFEGMGKSEKILERKELLKELIEEENDGYIKDQLSARISKMGKGIAIIYVGAGSELEAEEKKDRFQDALNAVKGAAEEGVVMGGGIEMLKISHLLGKKEQGFASKEEKIGYNILVSALKSPFYQILKNAHIEPYVIEERIFSEGFNMGYDVRKKMFCDFITTGVIDPVKVQKSAIKNSISVVSTLLMTSVAIYTTSA